jgi:hypothetical protein
MVKLITLHNIFSFENSEHWIGVVSNKRVSKEQYFVTLVDLNIQLSDNKKITIPKGFSFDGSSVPRLLENVLRRYGPFLFASLIHDWMYVNDYKRKELGLYKARSFADKEMLKWSDATNYHSNIALFDNWIRYIAVKLFGKKIYLE